MAAEAAAALPGAAAGYLRVWSVLPPRFRSLALGLFLGTLAGAALEVLSLWLLGALVSVITPGGGASSAAFRGWIGSSGDGLALQLVAITACAFLLKNLFMAALAWAEASFAYALQAYLADGCLAGILRLDYAAVASRRSSEYLNLLTVDLQLVIQQFVLPTLTAASEMLLLVAVLGFLLWLQPALTLAIIGAVGAACWIALRWSRRGMNRIGRHRQALEDERMRRLREVFGHLRDVYVYRAGEQARLRLQSGLGEIGRVYRAYQMMSTGPRFGLEIALVAVLLSTIVYGLRHDERHALIVSVGVFAASGFRLLIGANRLIMSAQGIRFARPAALRIVEHVEAARHQPPQTGNDADRAVLPRTLALEGVGYHYPGSDRPVLVDASMSLSRGRLVGVKGGSGAGKTTFLEVLCGLRSPTRGQMLLDGRPLRSADELFHLVGYVGQSAAVFTDTVRGNVAFGTSPAQADEQRVWRALERARIADFVRSLPDGLDAMLGEGAGVGLSGGQAQRLGLARALYADCPFLLLDEPTSALDPQTEQDVVQTLREIARDRAVLVVSHRPHPLQQCDDVYEMRDGRLYGA